MTTNAAATHSRWVAAALTLTTTTTLVLSGCSPEKPDPAFSRDPAVDTLPTVAADDQLVTTLPVNLQTHIVARASGQVTELAVALHGGECAVAVTSGGESGAARNTAPTSASDPVSSPAWAGAQDTLGPTSSVEAVVGNTKLTLYCGPKGASIRIEPGEITSFTGAISTAPESSSTDQRFIIGPNADRS